MNHMARRYSYRFVTKYVSFTLKERELLGRFLS
jgi:hypothetical protein